MMIENRKPMLAPSKIPSQEDVTFPMYFSRKLDGIRCLILPDWRIVSRNFKDIPNRRLREKFGRIIKASALCNVIFDGEIWSPSLPFSSISSIVRSFDKPVPEDLRYFTFDCVKLAGWLGRTVYPFSKRYSILCNLGEKLPEMRVLSQMLVYSFSEAISLRDEELSRGGEGGIIRDPSGPYKHGRCTLLENNMFKLKVVERDVAEVIGYLPLKRIRESIDREFDEFGHPKRVSKKDELEQVEELGALVVKFEDKIFKIGSGFDERGGEKDRRLLWNERDTLIGKKVLFKHMAQGAKDLPRLPIFLGWV